MAHPEGTNLGLGTSNTTQRCNLWHQQSASHILSSLAEAESRLEAYHRPGLLELLQMCQPAFLAALDNSGCAYRRKGLGSPHSPASNAPFDGERAVDRATSTSGELIDRGAEPGFSRMVSFFFL